MAEGLARSMGHQASSAGTHPGPEIAHNAAKLLESRGISTEGMIPKSVDGFNAEDFDMVISMGCGVHCPTMRIDDDWELEDPYGGPYEVYETTAAAVSCCMVLHRAFRAYPFCRTCSSACVRAIVCSTARVLYM